MRQDTRDTSSTRNRIIEWHDPGEVRDQADGLSVLETLRAIRDGKLPPPHIARLIGFHYARTEAGEIEDRPSTGEVAEGLGRDIS